MLLSMAFKSYLVAVKIAQTMMQIKSVPPVVQFPVERDLQDSSGLD